MTTTDDDARRAWADLLRKASIGIEMFGTNTAAAVRALGEVALIYNRSPLRRALRDAKDQWRVMPWYRRAMICARDPFGVPAERWIAARANEILREAHDGNDD